ncbi:OLC1v1022013C1 [Oldenlandia corymbosa var. corymbosa]|uniref:ER lumen protein-retaining receptor n=1 Tax=Oldenlandia corymbosa var. corymbosa TaxID=529605 RepID=A0AAV1BZI8_OLDCO|nr:OLC1v1022013C1 [Oldenlandia corymbosa var. corymbosa]
MNMFRLAGDMTHLLSILVLLLKIYATKSCAGISLKTQELYAVVFLTRYLDLFTDYISLYNTVMKVVFIVSSLAIVYCMRYHRTVRRSYNHDLDTFRHYFVILGCFVLALVVHEKFTIQEVLWAFSIYLEAVAILPQLVLLQRSGNVDNLTGQYVFLLGAYRGLYILNWIYRYFSEQHFGRWIACVSGLVQTALYADFFYYYFLRLDSDSIICGNGWWVLSAALGMTVPFFRFSLRFRVLIGGFPSERSVIYTVVSLFIFLVCSQLPLYGIHTNTGADPFYWMRAILASSRGTIMELGVTPIVTSGLSLFNLKVLRYKTQSRLPLLSLRRATALVLNVKPLSHCELYLSSQLCATHLANLSYLCCRNGAQKLPGILIAIGEAVAYVLSGMYGSIGQLGVGNAILIIVQLCFARIIVICLDELLQKGYGLGSGISLCVATNICENIICKAFSPTTINSGVALNSKNLPNVTDLLATVLIFLIVIYFQGFRVVLPVRSKNARGQQGSYPIKLFYTSNMPIILQSALVSNLYFISQLLHRKFSGNFFTWLVYWASGKNLNIQSINFCWWSGLLRDCTINLADMYGHPFHALFYLLFMLTACALFSQTGIEVSGSSARDVTKQLKEQQMVMPGHRETNLQKELNRDIPTAAAFGVCASVP